MRIRHVSSNQDTAFSLKSGLPCCDMYLVVLRRSLSFASLTSKSIWYSTTCERRFYKADVSLCCPRLHLLRFHRIHHSIKVSEQTSPDPQRNRSQPPMHPFQPLSLLSRYPSITECSNDHRQGCPTQSLDTAISPYSNHR
jgi:hypothetical protein